MLSPPIEYLCVIMYFISTRGDEKVTGAQAIAQGLAKDGGLFVPETFPTITKDDFEKMSEMSYPERAAYVLSKYFDDFGDEFLLDACKKAYAGFEGDDPVPLGRINEGLYIAAEFMLILSAPALSRRSTSCISCIPPPTVKGIFISAATRLTISVKVLRPSKLAVMSRKQSSSAPFSLYALPKATGSPAVRRLTKLVPFTVIPSFTSKQGMILFANIVP